jgi:hypothetical protein
MEINSYQPECLADWVKFNSFNWHKKTDVRIAQELYAIYVSFLDSCTTESDKDEFISLCLGNSTLALSDLDETKLKELIFKKHYRSENLPENIETVLMFSGVFQSALEQMDF